jgi:hypothetical protein
MIPTRSKNKLPQTLSYPLGAMAITEALTDAPHTSELVLYFWDRPDWSASEFHRTLRDGLPSKVLVAKFTPSHNPGYGGKVSLMETSWSAVHWSIGVYPVLRESRHSVAELLKRQALPAVVEWLRGSESIGWDRCRHSIEFVFNPADNALSVSHQDGV